MCLFRCLIACLWFQNWMLQKQIGYSLSVLENCIHALHVLQLSRKGCSFMAIKNKYNQHRLKLLASWSNLFVLIASIYIFFKLISFDWTILAFLEQFKYVSMRIPYLEISALYFEAPLPSHWSSSTIFASHLPAYRGRQGPLVSERFHIFKTKISVKLWWLKFL